MNPDEIIKKHISKVPGIRIPFVNKLTADIIKELKDNGFVILEESTIQSYAALMKTKR